MVSNARDDVMLGVIITKGLLILNRKRNDLAAYQDRTLTNQRVEGISKKRWTMRIKSQ